MILKLLRISPLLSACTIGPLDSTRARLTVFSTNADGICLWNEITSSYNTIDIIYLTNNVFKCRKCFWQITEKCIFYETGTDFHGFLDILWCRSYLPSILVSILCCCGLYILSPTYYIYFSSVTKYLRHQLSRRS